MKKIFYLTLLAIMIAVTAQARTVQLEARINNVHGCGSGISSITNVSPNFGKSSSSDDYGVLARVECRLDIDKRQVNTSTFFFRPVDGEIIRDGDSLYLDDANGRTKLADKRLIGWKPVPGVKFLRHFQKEKKHYIVDVSIQID